MAIRSQFPAMMRQTTSQWLARALFVATFATTACASAFRAGDGPSDRALREQHLLSRATYGVRPQDLAEVRRVGIERWLDQQLEPAPKPAVADTPAAPNPTSPAATLSGAVVMRNGAQQQPVMMVRVGDVTQNINTLVFSKLDRAVKSERQLEEVMTDFWFNHFNVDFNKNIFVRYAIVDYEQNAIRRHVFGRFEDMLRATAHHAAMMIYLDNAQSVAPSAAARPAAPNRPTPGLNENYARELLELHTLGVNGGYTQQDVIEVARALTGWGIYNTTAPVQVGNNTAQQIRGVEFRYFPDHHDAGSKLVLGRALPAGRGMEEGDEILTMLAQHPATAQHIATKLVRHFVADDPPAELVDHLAHVFRSTGGDLRAVTRALFTSEEFYDPRHYRTKVKRPFEFVASVLRVSGATVQSSTALVTQLRGFGHLPYSEPAPTGYPTTADAWLSAGAMMGRVRYALDAAHQRVPNVRIDPAAIFGADGAQQLARWFPPPVPGTPMATELRSAFIGALLARTLPGVATDKLRMTIDEDLVRLGTSDPKIVVPRALALVLGSPEFQRF
jgi:uncharacterized protein (DUF1800 family)